MAAIGLASFSLGSSITSHAQNGTDTTPPTVGDKLADNWLAIVSMITSIGIILKILADRGWIPAKIGTGAVMAADGARANLDGRILMGKVFDTFIDTLKIDSPEMASKIEAAASKASDLIKEKIDEYEPKVKKFENIAKSVSDSGEKTVTEIKDDQNLKENIPNGIIPTEEPTSPE
jgi:hypothetical protein